MKAIKWILAIMEDQGGSPSFKRFVTLIFVFFFSLIVKGSLNGQVVNQDVLFVCGAIILFGIGAIASETVAKVWGERNSTSSNIEITKTEKINS